MANYASSRDVDQPIVGTWSRDVTSEVVPVGGRQGEETGEAAPPQMTYACICYDFVIEALLMGALCLFGFAGNSVSTVCLWRDCSRSATPFLLVSLGVADTLFLATVFALRVLTSIDTFAQPLTWLHPAVPYLGKYVYPTALVAETGTIYLTILVTVNRYVSVCWPYRASELCSVLSARFHVAVITLFAVLFNLPRYFEYEIVRHTTTAVPEMGDDTGVGVWNFTAVPPSVLPPISAGSATLLGLDWNKTYPNASNETPSHQLTSSIEYQATWLVQHPVYNLVYRNLLYFLVMFLFPLISLTFLNQRLIVELRRTRKKRARMRGGGGRRLGGGESARSEEDITLMLIVVFSSTEADEFSGQSVRFVDYQVSVEMPQEGKRHPETLREETRSPRAVSGCPGDADRRRHRLRRDPVAGRHDADPRQHPRPSPGHLSQPVLLLRAPQ